MTGWDRAMPAPVTKGQWQDLWNSWQAAEARADESEAKVARMEALAAVYDGHDQDYAQDIRDALAGRADR